MHLFFKFAFPDVTCLQEMAVMFACMKANDFRESKCSEEIETFNKCHKEHTVFFLQWQTFVSCDRYYYILQIIKSVFCYPGNEEASQAARRIRANSYWNQLQKPYNQTVESASSQASSVQRETIKYVAYCRVFCSVLCNFLSF